VVAVVKTAGGRALSVDGLRWQIQVRAHPPKGLWSRDGDSAELRYFRFGLWSERDGLSRVPLNPILDPGRMLRGLEELIAAVRGHAQALPFPVEPELEHWLLDREGDPLALIATALPDAALGSAPPGDWNAGRRGEERPFVSASLSAQGVAHCDATGCDAAGRHPHLESIERLIAEAAGPRRQAQWFRLDADGALGLEHGVPPGLAGRRLPLDALPPETLRRQWPRESDSTLVSEYIQWLASYLLTLPTLADALRGRLEYAAARHALALDGLWRLYPRILDPDLIKRARVEARLRHADALA
jgi:hypothetical protein